MRNYVYILNFLSLILLNTNSYCLHAGSYTRDSYTNKRIRNDSNFRNRETSFDTRLDSLSKLAGSFFLYDNTQLARNYKEVTHEEQIIDDEIYCASTANTIFLHFAKGENRSRNSLNIERDLKKIYNNNRIITTSTGHSPLYPIVALQQDDMLEILLTTYPDLCTQKIDEFGNTIFHYMASLGWKLGLTKSINLITSKFGRNKAVEIINIRNGIDGSEGYTATEVAFALGQEDIVNALSNVDVSFLNNQQQQNKIKNLIINGNMLKDRNRLHRTFLGFDASILLILGQDSETLAWIMENRKSYCYEDIDNYKNNLLHIMALCGYKEGIELLFRNQIFGLQNRKNALGDTPGCIVANSLQNSSILQDIMNMPETAYNMLDRTGNTAMHLMFKSKKLLRGKQYLENFIRKDKTLPSLLNSGLSMVKDKNGDSLLHYASKYALGSLIKLLSRCKNLPIQVTNINGETALDVYGLHITGKPDIDELKRTQNFLVNLYKGITTPVGTIAKHTAKHVYRKVTGRTKEQRHRKKRNNQNYY